MTWRFLSIAVVCLLPARAAMAQETLTLDRAIEQALAGNASLRAARAATAEADAVRDEARAARFPRISVSEAWQRGNQPVFVFSSLLSAREFGAANFDIPALNHPPAIGFFQTTVAAEQLLFDGGARRAAIDAATITRSMTASSADEASAAVTLQAAQTFGRLIAAQAGRRAAEGAEAAAREDLARVERHRDSGMATDADVLALAVHLAGVRQRAIQAAGDAAVARAELNRLMGSPIEREYEAIEPTVTMEVAPAAATLDALLAGAEAARPELRRAAAAEQLAEAARRQAGASVTPQIAARGVFDAGGTRFSDRASSWIVGGEIRWTFSTGGAELARRTRAAQAVARARAEREDLRAAVHVDVVAAVRRIETARARQAVGRAAVEQARESERIIRDRFDAGLAGVTDVLRASAAVLDAETQRISALVDGIVADALLRRAVGRAP